ncbi:MULTISPECIES: GerW family sporulation protein [Geobacillus]|uniref:GerW family sporulation protein n=1 Tax=Geobacillus thermodenitrificans TaxID=33940 RepID=A0ABY9QAU6_GEOTD|nr:MULTISPECIES: GerW family sporulation protein [Geobacillus]ATO38173.1 sporulation protein YtfJ [Geobacillus thermodenitrificans]KQB92330.1 spore protein [Geobacillus sp. PA-3]MED3716799.1 GerW family sporulation protein [Geobacillus thermodenitrificans]MED3905670.1 GerW family sporulation protein [Geobacillus thermodenitrificans]MED4918738.1 GerW family sporulation protein [Geobacillus thermodenitrificans]
MTNHPIQGLMTTAMENLKQMIDVNTIIGDPVETPDGSVILTVSKVGFGFAAGGSEFMLDGQQNGQGAQAGANGQSGQNGQNGQAQGSGHPFGGGSGGGVSITPIAFLVVNSSGVKLLHLDESTHLYEKLLDVAPQAFEKIQAMLKKNKKDEASSASANDFDI